MAGKQSREQYTRIRLTGTSLSGSRPGGFFVLRSLALLLAICAGAPAQTDVQQVGGRIVDPQGNAVPHAEVTLRHVLTGGAQRCSTNNGGEYSFLHVAPGQYVLTASAAGLATGTRVVQVRFDTPTPVDDIVLSVATVQQSLTVVSGSRVEELQQDSPLPVDVVAKQRIERTGYETVADVLGELPGVVTRNNASFSGAAQEQIDGIASQDILVLQDGLPIVGARGIRAGDDLMGAGDFR